MVKRAGNLLLIIIASLCILLISCQRVPGGEREQDTAAALQQVKTGTKGVELSLVPNYPPATIYDQNELIALLEIKNQGNHNLEPGDCFVKVTGFDPSILRGGLDLLRPCEENIETLEGKTVYNLDGGFNQVEFKASNIALPHGIFDYQPNLNFLVCYNYQIIASPQVCIDPLLYQVSSLQKACNYRKSVAVGGGQGGPVGISRVGVDMVGNRAIFDITVANLGSGTVLSPVSDLQGCGDATTVSRQDFDKVAYTVRLADATGTCNPRDGMVRLSNGRGKIICSFDVPGTTAYETPLLVDLNYNYMNSISKQVRVIKTPQ
ncbi:hypothetical protein J4479_03055 [Candidatus Woesearchaeota archaeon]|nr:hypothetical protein [Candidatus Woesearchaeota archaeon]